MLPCADFSMRSLSEKAKIVFGIMNKTCLIQQIIVELVYIRILDSGILVKYMVRIISIYHKALVGWSMAIIHAYGYLNRKKMLQTHLNDIKLEYFTSRTKQWEINERGCHFDQNWAFHKVNHSKKNPLKNYQNKETIATRMNSFKSMGTESTQHNLSIYWREGQKNKSTKRIQKSLQEGHIERNWWERT